jgi:Protein of unknown function (DUF2809)
MGRSMVIVLALFATTIALGLATRRFPAAFPAPVATYGGDALWAVMIFWLVALWRRHAATPHIGLAALGICVLVESSQLYHAPWIDAIRATSLGALALGYGFLWTDLVAYTVGVVLAAGIDALVVHRAS